MELSSSDRDDVIRRVERRLGVTPGRSRAVRDAVDRTLGALRADDMAAESATSAREAVATAVLAATSTPDLASRTRGALAGAGVPVQRMGIATEGRHTVVAIEVPGSAEAQVRAAATALGAGLSWRVGEA